MIEISSLSISYNKHPVVAIQSLVLDKGLVLFVGPNGSGKTTLLHCLAGLVPKKAGRISLNKKEKLVGRVNFAFSSLYCPENWNYQQAAAYQKFLQPDKKLSVIRKDLYDAFGVQAFKKVPFSDLSAGMRQKANILLALFGAPEAILLDEPEAHLDEKSLAALITSFTKLTDIGAQLICATHYTIPWQQHVEKEKMQMAQFPMLTA